MLCSKKNMNLKEKIEFLRNNPIFWSRLGFGFDPPVFEPITGECVLFSNECEGYKKTIREFYDAGIKIISTILPTGWVESDRFSYKTTDYVLKCIFDGAPEDVYYLPRIKLNVPADWCRNNPEDTFVYAKGLSRDEIVKCVETSAQDLMGYGGKRAGILNNDSVISLQSFSSKKWLRDAGEALKKNSGKTGTK